MSGGRRPDGPLVVVGDTLLDRDIDGQVRRICPDAPAPVLDEETTTDRPGGAGLAARLAAAQGYEVVLVTAIADDAAGARVCALLSTAGVQMYALALPGATPEKIRLRARGQVLMRLDRGGQASPPTGELPEAVHHVLGTAAAILVSDYGRGVTRHPGLRATLTGAAAPIVWDPHPRGCAPTPGARLVTPNDSELRTFTGLAEGAAQGTPTADGPALSAADGPAVSAADGPAVSAADGPALSAAIRGGHELRRRWRAGAVAVTLGARGAVLCQAGPTPLVAPAAPATGDTCGAGDRFAVSAALALAGGALVSEAVQEAVTRAAAYVAAGGAAAALATPAPARHPSTATRGSTGDRAEVAGPPPARVGVAAAAQVVAAVRARGGTVVATGGCFDLLHTGHIATLRAARRLGDCLIVCLNSDASVTGLKGPDRPVTPQHDRAELLTALECVDAVVIFDEPTPHAVLAWLRPDIWVKGGDYADGGPALPEAELVDHWGGQTVLVPYLTGRSTTTMIAAARGAARQSERQA